MSEKENAKVGPGKYVAYSYKLYDDASGELLFETPAKAPDVMVYGVTPDIVPGLVEALRDKAKGDKFEATLRPEAAFGERSDEFIMALDPEIFMRDGKLAKEVAVGALLPMMTAEGFRVQGLVTEIGDKIKMDFNHPFAGLTVRYEGKVEEVREATPEEIRPNHGCGGCGGGGCHDGDCGDGCCGGDSDGKGCCGGC